MRNKYKNLKYLIFLTIIILVIILNKLIYKKNQYVTDSQIKEYGSTSFINNSIKSKDTIALNTRNFTVEILGKNGKKYNSSGYNAIILYNTVMIPMNAVFPYIFENYKEGMEQELIYNTTTLNIKENIISVPNIMKVKDLDPKTFEYIDNKDYSNKNITDDTIIDNSVDVEIEDIEGVKYIPLYLLSNIDGISVSVDDKILYLSKEDEYYNSISAIDINKNLSNIVIDLEYDGEENVKTKYIGQELGALWREEAYKRIEKYRKNNVSVIVKNQNGDVVNNAKVQITMNKNEFKFGTAIRYLTNQRRRYSKL